MPKPANIVHTLLTSLLSFGGRSFASLSPPSYRKGDYMIKKVECIIKLRLELNRSFQQEQLALHRLEQKKQKKRIERAKAFEEELAKAINIYV